MSTPPDDGDGNELPDDFFNDLADAEFIENVVENPSHVGSEDDEQMVRCLAEIEKLQKDIERRKQKILQGEAGLSDTDKRKKRRSRSRSNSGSRRERKRRRSRSSSPSFGSRSGKGGRHQRHPDRRRSRSRSPHHRSKRSASTHKSLTFLEELERTFAEKGQAFPEKDLLMNKNAMHASQQIIPKNEPMPQMDYGNVGYNQPQSGFQGQQQTDFAPPLVTYPIQQNMYYGLNPMAVLAGTPIMMHERPPMPTTSAQFPVVNQPPPLPEPHPRVAKPKPTDDVVHAANRNALIERCEQAIKLIRAKDNKVPVMKFLYNRSSIAVVANETKQLNNKSPLQIHSTLNVPFKLNAEPTVQVNKVAGIRMLPKRVKDICTALGINSSMMFDKLRTKELSIQITDQIKNELETVESPREEILLQTKTIPTVEKGEMSTQTAPIECEPCLDRKKRVMINQHTQIFLKFSSIGIQTNEKDYREPIVEQLSSMTAAQLVAIKDFANIITEPRPQNSVEMFKIRERMMDIYNLSQRDADAVRAAEEQRLDDPNYIDQLRSRSSCDMFRDASPQDFGMPHSPVFHNGNVSSNFNGPKSNDRYLMEEREQQRLQEEREYQLRLRDDQERRIIEEQRANQRLLEIERQRERDMEIEQRQFEQQRRDQIELELRERRILEERRLEHERHIRQLAMQQQQQPFDDNRGFNRAPDDRQPFNSNRGSSIVNRRGRGAFRDNGWSGRGGRR